MQLKSLFLTLSLLICICTSALAQNKNPFIGKWDISGTGKHADHVYWLEVKQEGDTLKGYFLNRGGSVLPLPEIAIEKDELIFTPKYDTKNPKPINKAKIVKGKLAGTFTVGENKIEWVGVRSPKWGKFDANAKHKFGAPIALFDGKNADLQNWDVQWKNKPSGWSVVDGTLTNVPHANNIISKNKSFKNFKIQCEYKLEDKSNSGIYLRGRYELQVLDDYGQPPESHRHMALYSRVAPSQNASLKQGEWQTMEAVIIGNRVTVTLNGKKVHDNIVIDGITGGALDSNENAPGPIMIQGDHEKVTYRKIIVTPIVK